MGREVSEATAEVGPVTGTVVQAFTTRNVAQVFQLAGSLPTETWGGNVQGGLPEDQGFRGRPTPGSVEHSVPQTAF